MIKFLILALTLSMQAFAKENKKGRDLAIKMQKKAEGFVTDKSTLEMILVNAHGDKVVRKMESMTKEVKEDGDKKLMTFLWPTDVKGTKLLTLAHKDKDDDQWLYLPAFKRVKRISSRNKSGAFMGSEFSYEDMGSQDIEKYEFFYLKDEKLGKHNCHKMERFPKSKSSYSKQIMWIDTKKLVARKIEYYNKRKELLKVSTFENFKKQKKWWRADVITMNNVQTKNKSILKVVKKELGVNLRDALFRKTKLK